MPYDKSKLTLKENAFVCELVKTTDKYKAYINAGYYSKNKGSMAAAVSRLLKMPKIKEAVAQLQQDAANMAMVTPARIIAELAKLGFSVNHPDKLRALDLLGKVKGIYEQDNSQKVVVPVLGVREKAALEPLVRDFKLKLAERN
jgi:hypothetical protein